MGDHRSEVLYDWEYLRDGTRFHTGPVSFNGCSLLPDTTKYGKLIAAPAYVVYRAISYDD